MKKLKKRSVLILALLNCLATLNPVWASNDKPSIPKKVECCAEMPIGTPTPLSKLWLGYKMIPLGTLKEECPTNIDLSTFKLNSQVPDRIIAQTVEQIKNSVVGDSARCSHSWNTTFTSDIRNQVASGYFKSVLQKFVQVSLPSKHKSVHLDTRFHRLQTLIYRLMNYEPSVSCIGVSEAASSELGSTVIPLPKGLSGGILSPRKRFTDAEKLSQVPVEESTLCITPKARLQALVTLLEKLQDEDIHLFGDERTSSLVRALKDIISKRVITNVQSLLITEGSTPYPTLLKPGDLGILVELYVNPTQKQYTLFVIHNDAGSDTIRRTESSHDLVRTRTAGKLRHSSSSGALVANPTSPIVFLGKSTASTMGSDLKHSETLCAPLELVGCYRSTQSSFRSLSSSRQDMLESDETSVDWHSVCESIKSHFESREETGFPEFNFLPDHYNIKVISKIERAIKELAGSETLASLSAPTSPIDAPSISVSGRYAEIMRLLYTEVAKGGGENPKRDFEVFQSALSQLRKEGINLLPQTEMDELLGFRSDCVRDFAVTFMQEDTDKYKRGDMAILLCLANGSHTLKTVYILR